MTGRILWDNDIEGSGLTQHYVGTHEAARLLGVSYNAFRAAVRRHGVRVIHTPVGGIVCRHDLLILRGEGGTRRVM